MLFSDHKFSKRAFVESLLNDVEQNLQSGQLHHWAASSDAEIMTSLFAVVIFIPVKESQIPCEGLLNPFEGLLNPFERLFNPFEGLFGPFEKLWSPFKGLFGPF